MTMIGWPPSMTFDNPDGPDHDYFRGFVNDVSPHVVMDLGCGTGILTVTLAAPGRTVVGIDPAPAMLNIAAARPGAGDVEWRLGAGEQIGTNTADVVIMSGNVAMHIIEDQWHQALDHIARCLRPGGVLAFEARNPLAKAWESWNEPLAERETPAGRLRESLVTDPPNDAGVVSMHCYNEFVDDGTVVEVDQMLQFRSFDQLRADLSAAGLDLVNTWRDW
ncbi:MAG: class I SAM-dependent methyltransferase, partial [Propionibacteriaceae bacterium]|nr:class I SAM-dependent methyltransferase [Propionibacteriaceae bacterium]